MTPTTDDIEAALPHVPAGLHCGDLTEADERRQFAVTVHEIVVRASTGHTDPNPAPLVEWGADEVKIAQAYASPLRNPKQGDRWETRGDTVTLVASNDWPPPKPGTHESDVLPFDRKYWRAGLAGVNPAGHPRGGIREFYDAQRWSKENAR